MLFLLLLSANQEFPKIPVNQQMVHREGILEKDTIVICENVVH
jgi:hypothetical protein